jgi:hypothetical protein
MNNYTEFGPGERDLVSKRYEAKDLVDYISEVAQQYQY